MSSIKNGLHWCLAGGWAYRNFAMRARVHRSTEVEGRGGISIGHDVCLARNGRLLCLSDYAQARHVSTLDIGSGTYIGPGFVLCAWGEIKIEENVLMGDNVYISTATHGYEDIATPPLRQPLSDPTKLMIGRDCWIGRQTTIVGGLTIGQHAVIGANSFVNCDIPPFCVAVGSPARVVKRYDPASARWVKVTRSTVPASPT